MTALSLASRLGFRGSYRIIALPALEVAEPTQEQKIARIEAYQRGEIEPLEVVEAENLIVANANRGLNLIFQHFGGTTTYPLNLNKAAIGTGTATPTAADTALQTPALTNIDRSTATVGTSSIVLTFFMTASELANGTYREFGLYAGTQLFARSLISGSGYTKATGVDTLVEYTITGAAL
jgi:hypothetical protein